MRPFEIRDQAYIKRHNIFSVLSALRERQPLSRTEIARLTEMSPTSITRITAALIKLGLVTETEREHSLTRGRKAIDLTIDKDGMYAVGVFADYNQLRLGAIDLSDRLLYTVSAPVDPARQHSPAEIAKQAHALYRAMPESVARDRSRVRAVGVAVAGIVDPARGVVVRSDQMHWMNEDLANAFREEFQMEARIENDVKACLIGEKARMDIPASEDTAYLLVGAGIGLAVTGNGKLLRGKHNEAGEIERISLSLKSAAAAPDMLETHLIDRCLIERARQVDASVKSVDAIVMAYRQGIEWAQVLLADFKRYLSLVIAMLDGIVNPERIVLGGSTIELVAEPLLHDLLQNPRVRAGDRYEDASLLGAALIAMESGVESAIAQFAQAEEQE